MTTTEFNSWATRFMAALEASRMERAAARLLNDQRTACATTYNLENEGATI